MHLCNYSWCYTGSHSFYLHRLVPAFDTQQLLTFGTARQLIVGAMNTVRRLQSVHTIIRNISLSWNKSETWKPYIFKMTFRIHLKYGLVQKWSHARTSTVRAHCGSAVHDLQQHFHLCYVLLHRLCNSDYVAHCLTRTKLFLYSGPRWLWLNKLEVCESRKVVAITYDLLVTKRFCAKRSIRIP